MLPRHWIEVRDECDYCPIVAGRCANGASAKADPPGAKVDAEGTHAGRSFGGSSALVPEHQP